jgi:hypothetical protein
LRAYRGAHQEWVAAADALARAVNDIHPQRALVFVIEDIASHPERSSVQNVVDLNHAPLVLAHDRGERDSLLIESLRDRAAYVLREENANGVVRFRLDPIGQQKRP